MKNSTSQHFTFKNYKINIWKKAEQKIVRNYFWGVGTDQNKEMVKWKYAALTQSNKICIIQLISDKTHYRSKKQMLKIKRVILLRS